MDFFSYVVFAYNSFLYFLLSFYVVVILYMGKIVLAIDSFKGCLSSTCVEQAAKEGILSRFSSAEVFSVPVSDGGEGILAAFSEMKNMRRIPLRAHNPLMQMIDTEYGVLEDERVAIVEMAKIAGLCLIAEDKRNPLFTTTYGLGEIIADAVGRGYNKFVIGVGGSATNDGGVGLLQALGYRMFDINNRLLGFGAQILSLIHRVDLSSVLSGLEKCHFTIICDVDNVLCGKNGAAYIFAPQKGATQEMIVELDEALHHFADVIMTQKGLDVLNIPGVGAAGGIGAAFLGFLNAHLKSGIDAVLELLHFDALLHDADLVVTGEGKIDKQTLMGKVPYGILQWANKKKVPVIAICGSLEDEEILKKGGFDKIVCINPENVFLKEAMNANYASRQIKETMAKIIESFFS